MADILWEGQSLLDLTYTIRVYGTGRKTRSQNGKTGAVLQTYILLRDVDPVTAVRAGADAAICGDCVHRQTPRSCYVNVGQAPHAIHHGRSEPWGQLLWTWGKDAIVRLGAYGDPAAVPFGFWQLLLGEAAGWLGYTHQWRSCDQRLKRFCMASVETEDEYDAAHDLGWRCFWAGDSLTTMPNDERITLCPASAEAGKRLTCEQCMSCSGLGLSQRIGDIYIPVHGTSWMRRNYLEKVA